VKEHQVQVRSVANFLSTELAVGNDGKARRFRRSDTMTWLSQRPCSPQCFGEQQVRKGGQVIRQGLDAQLPLEILRQKLEGVLMLIIPHQIHLFFYIGLTVRQYRRIQLACELNARLGEIGRLHEGMPLDQAIQKYGVAVEIL